MTKRIFTAITLLCALLGAGSPLHAQKTKAQLNSEITSQFPDNNQGLITPQVQRNVTQDMVNAIMPTAPVGDSNVAVYNGTTGLLKDGGPIATVINLACTLSPSTCGFLFGYYNAVWYGVKCDGTTHDSAAIQTGLNATSSKGGLKFPAGTCFIDADVYQNKSTAPGPLTVPGVTLQGAGKGVTIFDSHVANDWAFTVNRAWKVAFQALSGISATSGSPGALGIGPIGTLGSITAGSSYTNGTYSGVSLTGGTGSGATANITVSGAVVSAVTLVNPGTGYSIGDTLSAAAASIGGTGSGFSIPVASITYWVQITANDPNNSNVETFVTLPKSVAVTSLTGRIQVVLSQTDPGYTYNIYLSTSSTPGNYAIVNGVNAIGLAANQTVFLDNIGSVHAVPASPTAIWQQGGLSDLTITSSTAPSNASGFMCFKCGYFQVRNVVFSNFTGDGYDLPSFAGDIDGPFNNGVFNSKFDNIKGACLNAAGLVLENTSFTVDQLSAFNLCGTLPLNQGPSFPFTISAITNAGIGVVTTSSPHTLQANDQLFIQGVAGMTLATGSYRVCQTSLVVVTPTTFGLCTTNGAVINTTALGSYTPNSGSEYLAWRPPTLTTFTGAIAWQGLLGTFRNSNSTQAAGTMFYAAETGSSDNLTIENMDCENTFGKCWYIGDLVGGTLKKFECLSTQAVGDTISCLQIGTGFNAGGVQNFIAEVGKVRKNTGPITAFEQFQNTIIGTTFQDTNHVRNIGWQTLPASNALRFSGWVFDPIAGEVQFSVTGANQVSLTPVGYGGCLPVHLASPGEWLCYHVPSAGISGSVTGSLTPSTTFNCYAFNSQSIALLPISISFECNSTATALDEGYSVKSTDTTRTFIGQADTDGSGNFQTTGRQASWYPAAPSSSLGGLSLAGNLSVTGSIAFKTALNVNAKLAISTTAPTVASGFCSSPAISSANGSAAFTITIGSACAASSGVLTMPAANAGWKCDFSNVTNPNTNKPDMTASGSTTVNVTNYSRTTGSATNWTNADVINASCTAF